MKTAESKRAKPWMKSASLAVAAFAVALLGTGCNPECVDQFDCRADNGEAPAGQQWVCVDEKCETEPLPTTPTPDAGTPDSGTPDAGQPDSGTPDAGQPDSGTPDAGQPDSGTPDSGTPDAGEPDAGTPDAGEPDAGPVVVDCATVPLDPKLGTLVLQPGFVAAESVALSPDILALGASPGPTYTFYGIQGRGKDAALFSLGTWPNLQPGTTKLFDIVTQADRDGSATVYPGGYVINDGLRVFAGYTLGATGSPGNVAMYDLAMPDGSNYVVAPKNFSAASFSSGDLSTVLVNGGGLGALPVPPTPGDLGVFALVTSTDPMGTVRAVNFPQGDVVGSGFTAVTDTGVAALGYFDQNFVNVLHGVAPATLATAITSGTPLDLGTQAKVDVGSDFNDVAAFGGGVVLNRGAYAPPDYDFVATDVSRYALSVGANDAVTVGARVPVLTYVNQCTTVRMLKALGSDVLVGVSDRNGRRLVRLQVAP
ncbi:hypothetical protein SAMN05443572_104324 [Myxococcus fulvus]|uniref:Lipoprotein n=1 Tax=Myxococcus fulvus TaxID=33 RepID=A0A511SYT0_MYXFU|nr:hypothetical protein [Myxococcus fulvus]GEN07050.1 hypothetical protein MFU01_20870 [Myxococcus fulvus]SEU00794.1 hypothetical protein SAMN05443572_104324 [Myxococcus fulvus]